MNDRTIEIKPLTSEAFASFGDLVEFSGEPSFQINQGMCDRFHDLANLDFIGEEPRANISLGRARPYHLPLTLKMMERHPLGSQAFIPLNEQPFLIVVAGDASGQPDKPCAFLSNGAQGVNYHRNTWHGILTPLYHEQPFLIVDREGKGNNLEEYHFSEPFLITHKGSTKV